MRDYATEFKDLYNRQPKLLSSVEKLLRIDKLATRELAIAIQFDKKPDSRWYFMMVVTITHLYLVAFRDLAEEPLIAELNKYHAWRLRQANLTKSESELQSFIGQYIELRQQLHQIIEIKERH